MKTCSKCGEDKEGGEFYKKYSQCKMCARDQSAKWRKENTEKKKAANAAWYKANKEKAKESRRARYEANRPKEKDLHKKWRAANTEKIKHYNLKWRTENPVKHRACGLRKRAPKGTPEIIIETQAINNLIRHTIQQQEKQL